MTRGLRVVVVGALLFAFALPDSAAAARRGSRARASAPRKVPNMPPGWAWPPTPAMQDEGASCTAALDRAGVVWQPHQATRKIATPVVVPSMDFAGLKLSSSRRGPHPMDCHLALALATALAPALREVGVRELVFSELHDYRTLARRRSVLSRHAVGLAIDVVALVALDGTVLDVERDYRRGDTLRRAEALVNASGAFRRTISPGNDRRGHHDHFHIEARTPTDRPTRVATPIS